MHSLALCRFSKKHRKAVHYTSGNSARTVDQKTQVVRHFPRHSTCRIVRNSALPIRFLAVDFLVIPEISE